ncbi:MAG: asparagine synthase (glutamine-hydrolyzing) [Candidatus Andersenbacteria bacterium]|nr:asparagine synthase (glutamine-hydrolyzing) [Candidatus Andersenbacteria bacterium]
MCGIVGVLQKNGEGVKQSFLQPLTAALAHRGPDDSGQFIDGPVGFGHRRLSILDLTSAGHQPMVTADGRYAIVFNGEIYNFRELHKHYLADVPLSSQSDTEVLMYLLGKHGVSVLPELRGMFAFAFWDRQAGQLLLANDPFGKKPLYFRETDAHFLFASEPKALLAAAGTSSVCKKEALGTYVLHEYVPAPESGFEGIKKMPMGHVLTVTSGGVRELKPWWKPVFLPKSGLPEGRALAKLDELLGQAVQRRLVADVPVGIFLSGGLDSTTILWYMRQARATAIESCSVSFGEATFNESAFMAMAARAFQTSHHTTVFKAEDVPVLLDQVMELMDVPLADASLLPTFAVSRLAREHMKVVLSGDGADELFGGYGTFQAGELAAKVDAFVPDSLWPPVQRLAALLPVSHNYFSFDFKVKSFLRGMPYPAARRNQVWLGSFSDQEAHSLLRGHVSAQVFSVVDAAERKWRGLDTFDLISALTIEHYLQDDILVKLDRATMMVGLEARTPFLDLDVAEFVMRLPSKMRRHKYLLKKLMRGRIPAAIIDRPKKGFGIPLGEWLAGPLADWMRSQLNRADIESQGYFSWPYIERLMQEHMSRTFDHRKKLWTLLMWQRWYKRWVV